VTVGDRVRITERFADQLRRAGCAAHYVDALRAGGTLITIHGPSTYVWRLYGRSALSDGSGMLEHFDDPQDLEVIE